MRIFIRDVRSPWGKRLAHTARRRRWSVRIAGEVDADGFGFIRLHSNPEKIGKDREIAAAMAKRLVMVQDATQIAVYDDKVAQARLWPEWMPETWIYESRDAAMGYAGDFPVISKAAVGASSQNVRLIENRQSLEDHINLAFGEGITVRHGSGDGYKSFQRGYVLLQRFIPHDTTYRVNAIGGQRAVFLRSCYPDRPMAQTGNVCPSYDPPADLMEFAEAFFQQSGTKWCALDILKDGDGWRLLETSLAWPHPSPGECNNAPFFPNGRKWIDMWDVLLDELESGAWHSTSMSA